MLDLSQGLGMLLRKEQAITWLWSVIRVDSCGLVRNGSRGYGTLHHNKDVMFREEETPPELNVCLQLLALLHTFLHFRVCVGIATCVCVDRRWCLKRIKVASQGPWILHLCSTLQSL